MTDTHDGENGPGLDPELRDRIEEWFIRRGIPHFIDKYNAAEDVFTRALPAMTLVFVFEVVIAADTDWDWWHNALALAAGAALLAGGYAALNRYRGRPAFQRPDDVGPLELAGFVFLPALLPLVIGGRFKGALLTVGFNIAVLLVLYAVILYGVVPMTRWALVHMWQQLGGLLNLMARSLPLILVFSMFVFLTAEIWQVAAELTPRAFAMAVGMFMAVGATFILLRLPQEVDRLRRFSSWDEVCDYLDDSPLCAEDVADLTGVPQPPALTRADWFNVGLIWVFSQGVQILLVWAVVTGFYVLFGSFLVDPAVITSWTTHPTVSGWSPADGFVVTWELATVAGFIGAFSALQITVAAVIDDTYRSEFLTDLINEVRSAFAVRAVYLARMGVTVSR
ncbi:MAG TPA: hypothetical protein ENI86_00725 [Acidimicrobiales bacterium]|nr:hypothetical protein [Acidimicrobiales bacterium]